VTPNDFVRIKPTEAGWKAIQASVDESNAYMQGWEPHTAFRFELPVADSDGYIRNQFWALMVYFDWALGSDAPFSDLQICTRSQVAHADEPTGEDWKDLRKMLDMGPLTTERERVRQAIVAIGLLRAACDAAHEPIPEEGRWAYETYCAVQGVAPCWHAIPLAIQQKWVDAALACKNRREVV
jgi:hypothetical protein